MLIIFKFPSLHLKFKHVCAFDTFPRQICTDVKRRRAGLVSGWLTCCAAPTACFSVVVKVI